MKKIIAGVVGVCICACAPPTQFLVKKYTPDQLDNKTLVIYPVVARQVIIANTEDFEDDFADVKSAPNEFMRQEINQKAAEYFESGFKHVQVLNVENANLPSLMASNSESITKKIGEELFEIRIPNFMHLEKHGFQPKFVLVLDEIQFSRHLETFQRMNYGAPVTFNSGGTMAHAGPHFATGTATQKSMAMGLNYLLYDYEEKAVVGYGFAKGDKPFTFAMTRSDWYAAMITAFGAVKKFTPFK